MKQKIKTVAGIAVFVLLIVIAVIVYNWLSGQVKPDTGTEPASVSDKSNPNTDNDKDRAPDFTMTDSDGGGINLSDMRGKPVVLNFWASWCPPCKTEMPDFEKAYLELGGEVQFMMVNLTDGMRETKESGARYVRDQGYTFPVFFDDRQEGAAVYGIRAIPTTLFIDKDGCIIAQMQGAIDENTLREKIAMIQPR